MQTIILGQGELEKIVLAMEYAKERTSEEYDALFKQTLEKIKDALEKSKRDDY